MHHFSLDKIYWKKYWEKSNIDTKLKRAFSTGENRWENISMKDKYWHNQLTKALIDLLNANNAICRDLSIMQYTRKTLTKGSLFKKKLKPATLLRKRLWHRCFPVNFAKILRTPFCQNNSGRLLVKGKGKLFIADFTFFGAFWYALVAFLKHLSSLKYKRTFITEWNTKELVSLLLLPSSR